MEQQYAVPACTLPDSRKVQCPGRALTATLSATLRRSSSTKLSWTSASCTLCSAAACEVLAAKRTLLAAGASSADRARPASTAGLGPACSGCFSAYSTQETPCQGQRASGKA